MAVANKGTHIPDPFRNLNFPLPALPESVSKEFPELLAWHQQMQDWYSDVKKALEENQKILLAKTSKTS